jgi:hypothetical protein
MLKTNLCILMTVLLALLWCGGVAAGPKNPDHGDPDIVEGVSFGDRAPQHYLGSGLGTGFVVDVPLLGRAFFSVQEQTYHLRKMSERLPAAIRRYDISF